MLCLQMNCYTLIVLQGEMIDPNYHHHLVMCVSEKTLGFFHQQPDISFVDCLFLHFISEITVMFEVTLPITLTFPTNSLAVYALTTPFPSIPIHSPFPGGRLIDTHVFSFFSCIND